MADDMVVPVRAVRGGGNVGAALVAGALGLVCAAGVTMLAGGGAPGAGPPGAASSQPASRPDVRRLVADLSGPDALAEARASDALVAAGDAAVPALAELAGGPGPLAARLTAVELLGRIGSPTAGDALIALLRREKDLAVRGQICLQLGCAGERRAVPVLLDWLKTIGPKAIDDVPGPKECQPSTCYIRHVEALAMIGDPAAIPALEEFAGRIPKGIGYGGFITNFVTGVVTEALEDLKERQAFLSAVRKHPGLEDRLNVLAESFRSDPLARFRLHEDEVVRLTDAGKAALQRLAGGGDPALSAAAKALLQEWDALRADVKGTRK